MMEGIRDYVIHLTATSLICAVIFRFAHGSGAVKMIIKMLCGIILAYSIVQPVKQLDLSGVEEFASEFREEADRAVQQGKNASAAADTVDKSQKSGLDLQGAFHCSGQAMS